jgi:hypothetical protein
VEADLDPDADFELNPGDADCDTGSDSDADSDAGSDTPGEVAPSPNRQLVDPALGLPIAKAYYGTHGLILFTGARQDLLTKSGGWSEEAGDYAMSGFSDGLHDWPVDSPVPPWGATMPFTVLVGSRDGTNLSLRSRDDSDVELTRPVGELADILVSTPGFEEFLAGDPGRSVLVMLPATFDEASAARAVDEVAARLRGHGLTRPVHGVLGSMLTSRGRLTVPSWTGTA